jgi:DNA modification methylase
MNEMVALINTPELPRNTVICGDCLEELWKMPDCSVDAIVTDPPAGINFMNMAFDSDKGGRNQWIAWLTEVMKEALRVIRPGGHAFVWALPRTSHWTATALEDAGWEIREVVVHLFGSGFPKSHNISAAIDKHFKAEREVIGKYDSRSAYDGHERTSNGKYEKCITGDRTYGEFDITAPATPEAARYSGYGTALKPSNEHWILCRKPLSEPTIAQNVLKWNGCGGLNIDACRVGTHEYTQEQWTQKGLSRVTGNSYGEHKGSDNPVPQGRWPSNTLFSHSLFCVPKGVKRVRGDGHKLNNPINRHGHGFFGEDKPRISKRERYNDPDGMETVDAWECSDDCPVRILGEQSGVRKTGDVGLYVRKGGNKVYGLGLAGEGQTNTALHKGDTGTAARYFAQFSPSPDELEVPYFYAPKASRAERNRGCEGLPEKQTLIGAERHKVNPMTGKPVVDIPRTNTHPTVKSLSLMKYLCRLVGVPGGVILDPFMGSGSTGVAALQEGFNFIGIEQDASYVEIARARIQHAMQEAGIVEVQGDGGEWICSDDCPVKILGEQSGIRKHGGPIKSNGVGMFHGAKTVATTDHYGDEGTAARYFAQFAPDSLWSLLEDEVPE